MICAKAIVLAAAALISTASAQWVTLYDQPGFQGESYQQFSPQGGCYNVRKFNDRASSAQWDHTPPNSYVQFWTDENCQGTVRSWPAADRNFPNNFAVDGIDNTVSSVRVT